jgi:hypothetical protein
MRGEIDDMFGGRSEVGRELGRNKAIADRHGLPLVAYEGGQHFVSWDTPRLDPVIVKLNRRPEIYRIYRQYLDGWQSFGGSTFVHFHLAGVWSEKEAFGLLEYGTQAPEAAPKYRALADWIAGHETDGKNPSSNKGIDGH